jgi:hypothetical protein
MITVTKEYDDEDPGVTLIEYKTKRRTEIYVADVKRGPFYKTGECVLLSGRLNDYDMLYRVMNEIDSSK